MSDATIVHVLRRHAEQRGGERAFEFLHGGAAALRQLGFAHLDRLAGAVAGWLARDRDRAPVLLVFEPGLEFVVAFLGCLAAGRPAVPVRPPRCADDVAWLRRVQAKVGAGRLLVDATSHGPLAALGADVLDWLGDDAAVDDHGQARPGDWPSADATAFVQFTSGSTGDPRGVIVRHANLVDNQRVIAAAFGHDQATTVVGWLPHYHDMGLIGNVLQPLFLGRPCALMAPTTFLQRPIRWLRAIAERRAVTSGGPNFAFQHCVRAIGERDLAAVPKLDLSGWRLAFVGAEPVRAATMAAFAERFAPFGFAAGALYPCYGLAEATLMLTGGRAGGGVARVALDREGLAAGRATPAAAGDAAEVVGCGHARGDNAVRIVDPEDRTPVPDAHVGEIWATGPSIAAGYFCDATATEQRFGGRLRDDDGTRYLRTGDLGFVRDGQLFVTGRLGSRLVLNGRKLYPQDIEDVLVALHPAFRPCGAAAFCVDTAVGARLVVVQEVRGAAIASLDPEAVLTAARGVVSARFGVRLDDLVPTTDALPRTSSGKIRHHEARRRYLAEGFARAMPTAPANDGERDG